MSVVIGEVGEMVVQVVGDKLLDRLSNTLVNCAPPVRQHRIVGDLLSQRMLERVLDLREGGLFVDELAELQVAQHAV